MSDEAKIYVIENFLELGPTSIEQISVNVAKKVDEFSREMNYYTRRRIIKYDRNSLILVAINLYF